MYMWKKVTDGTVQYFMTVIPKWFTMEIRSAGVLGHIFSLLRVNWPGDNLG